VAQEKGAADAVSEESMADVVPEKGSAAAKEKPADLASQARDPTAPVTAFVIRYDFISNFHNLPDTSQQQLVLQPVIPWKWGKQVHIARVTVPYVTSAPYWGQLAEDEANGLPPNYTPTKDVIGLADTALDDLIVMPTSWGRVKWGQW
jgi:hypothetical protein